MSALAFHRINSRRNGNPDLTVARPCPVCREDGFETLFVLSDFQFFVDLDGLANQVGFRAVQCRACNAIYTNPVYSKLGFERLFDLAGLSYGFHNPKRMELIAKDLGAHLALTAETTLLDVGCGAGSLLRALPAKLQRVGVDIDRFSIERASALPENEGIELICADFEELPLDISPDVITLFHVLEHLTDPLTTLERLNELGHDATKLVVEVPVLENSATNDINGFFVVQHLTHFSESSLQNILAAAGWHIDGAAHQPDYRGYRVYASKAKTSMTPSRAIDDRRLALEALAGWHSNLAALNSRVDEALSRLDVEKIVIWGAGMHTEVLYHFVDALSRKPYRFLLADGDERKVGHTWRDVHIISSSELEEIDWSDCALLLSSYGGQPGMYSRAAELGIPEPHILALYDTVRVY